MDRHQDLSTFTITHHPLEVDERLMSYQDQYLSATVDAGGRLREVGRLTLDSMQDYLRAVGRVEPDGPREVIAVQVDPRYRRLGIATAMWDRADELGLRPAPGRIQFLDGAAWTRALMDRRAVDWQVAAATRPSPHCAPAAPGTQPNLPGLSI